MNKMGHFQLLPHADQISGSTSNSRQQDQDFVFYSSSSELLIMPWTCYGDLIFSSDIGLH